MSKDTKINIALTAWLLLGITATKAVFDSTLIYGTSDALCFAMFPSVPTLALAIALTFRLTK